MPRRTLVVTLGQLRAHALTWENFRTNVLDELQADLAVCVPTDSFFDFTNPFYQHARYRWLVPDYGDMADAFDRIHSLLGSSEDWRVICNIQGSWIGKISESNQPGSASILFVLRWFMLNNILSAQLTEIYDRFVITRSDFYYLCPHPPLDCLDPRYLWIPGGADFGGITDRHLVVSSQDLVDSCNLIDDLLLRPTEMLNAMMAKNDWNIECYIYQHYKRNNLLSRTKRFPYVMFLVRDTGDPTAWSEGNFDPKIGMVVKYHRELDLSERFAAIIRSAYDWRIFFANQITHEAKLTASLLEHNAGSKGAEYYYLYSNHETLVYADLGSGCLRHAPFGIAPLNLVLELTPRQGRLLMIGDGPSEVREVSVAQSPTDLHCRIEIIPEDQIALRAGEHYLSADPDGVVRNDRNWCRPWEQYRLIRIDIHHDDSTTTGLFASRASAIASEEPPNAARYLAPVNESAQVGSLFGLLEETCSYPDVSGVIDSDAHSFLNFAFDNCRRSRAQLFQDLWVLFELSSKHSGFFVEFGAGDGIDASNTYLLEDQYGWSGIVAEPNPIHHQMLKQNRRCYVSTMCIAASSNQLVSFVQTNDPIYATIEKYASNDMHAASRRHGAKIEVETLSLMDLLIAAEAPQKIDYLSIDTEGSELEILTSFDFDAYNITIITVEHNFTQQRESIYELLRDKGYERKFTEFSKWDDWYIKFPCSMRSTQRTCGAS